MWQTETQIFQEHWRTRSATDFRHQIESPFHSVKFAHVGSDSKKPESQATSTNHQDRRQSFHQNTLFCAYALLQLESEMTLASAITQCGSDNMHVFLFVYMCSCLSECMPCFHSLGPHQVLVFEGRSLKVDDPLGPQRDLEDTANLNVYLRWTQDHHVVVLQNKGYECFSFIYPAYPTRIPQQ